MNLLEENNIVKVRKPINLKIVENGIIYNFYKHFSKIGSKIIGR